MLTLGLLLHYCGLHGVALDHRANRRRTRMMTTAPTLRPPLQSRSLRLPYKIAQIAQVDAYPCVIVAETTLPRVHCRSFATGRHVSATPMHKRLTVLATTGPTGPLVWYFDMQFFAVCWNAELKGKDHG